MFEKRNIYHWHSLCRKVNNGKDACVKVQFNLTSKIAKPKVFPNVCYFEIMKDWQKFVNRSPEDYEKWIIEGNLEIAELIRIS